MIREVSPGVVSSNLFGLNQNLQNLHCRIYMLAMI